MSAPAWRSPAAVAAVLAVLGALAAAANVQMSRRYVEAAATLSRFQPVVRPVSLPGGAPGVRIEYQNPGPWQVALLEVQVLAWRDGVYLGAATRDLRAAPLVVPPGDSRAVELTLPPLSSTRGEEDASAQEPPGEAGTWFFSVSGRMELPIVGTRSFSRESRYPAGEGP